MSGDLRSRRRAATNRRIYEVAMQLFEEQGFDQVSVGEIASRAGVSVPTFYAHFPSKDRIVLQAADHGEIRQLLDGAGPATSVTEHVERVIRLWLEAFEEGDARAELLRQWRLVGDTRSLQMRASEIERDAASVVVEHLEYVRCDRTSLAVQLTVFTLFAASTQILMRWANEDGRRPLAEVCDHVMGVLRSLRTDPV
ncbi:TetR/AcrR family transcriptional regulator [Blastococcus sp. URHD0036]|uniref:TetR/AcrR family transcriptional regulator n=1 Tax=Blastococcus sp. URHD0036 TaxID=1380356 RepID=UPI0004954ED9|nr:TetR/AcrR family transcriptional regulator [Blastococcus sp. URHD0036]